MSRSAVAQQTFDQIEQELGAGMVPRIFKVLEPHPLLLVHIWGQFRAVVLQGRLPRVLKEMIGLVVAKATHCDYVRLVHLHRLSLQGVEPNVLEAVSQGNYEAVELSTMAQKALKLAALATATSVASGDGSDRSTWKELRQQTTDTLDTMYLGEEDKIELVATLALFEQLCTLANLLALDPTQP